MKKRMSPAQKKALLSLTLFSQLSFGPCVAQQLPRPYPPRGPPEPVKAAEEERGHVRLLSSSVPAAGAFQRNHTCSGANCRWPFSGLFAAPCLGYGVCCRAACHCVEGGGAPPRVRLQVCGWLLSLCCGNGIWALAGAADAQGAPLVGPLNVPCAAGECFPSAPSPERRASWPCASRAHRPPNLKKGTAAAGSVDLRFLPSWRIPQCLHGLQAGQYCTGASWLRKEHDAAPRHTKRRMLCRASPMSGSWPKITAGESDNSS